MGPTLPKSGSRGAGSKALGSIIFTAEVAATSRFLGPNSKQGTGTCMKQALNVILMQVVFAEHTLTVCKGFVFYKVTNLVPMLKQK